MSVVRKPVLAIDVDEVLALFIPALATFHNSLYATALDSTHFHTYEFHKVWGGSREETMVKMEIFFESKHFVEDIGPVQGAYEALLELRDRYELHIVTARQHKVEKVTREWIERYYPGVFAELHFGNHYSTDGKSRTKYEICTSIGAFMLVDDSIVYAKQCAEKGLPVVLFGSYPWNRLDSGDEERFGDRLIHRVGCWAAVGAVVDSVYHRALSEAAVAAAAAVSQSLSTEHSGGGGIGIAAIQMCSSSDKEANIRTIQRLCGVAVSRGASFIALPECCLYMGSSAAETVASAEDITTSKYLDLLTDIAVSNHVFLSIGSVHERRDDAGEGGKISNTQLLISPHGVRVAKYRKTHLFDSPRAGLFESALTVAGDSLHVVDCSIATVGLSVCYDLRFPEVFSRLRSQGAEIITAPSAFTCETGSAHWLTLCRARAVETQCYLIAAAQAGRHNAKRCSHGQTVIISPWGDVLAELPSFEEGSDTGLDIEGVAVAVFDRSFLERVREGMPVHSHRRPELY